MGSNCCHAESPCGSEEERSVLLKGDPKAVASTGEKVLLRTNGQEDDGIRMTPDEANMKVEIKAEAVQVKQRPEVGETAPNSTQENGPLPEAIRKRATPSPKKGPELRENAIRAQDEDVKHGPADGGQPDLPKCTLNSLQKQDATADWEVFTATPEEENPASAQDAARDVSSLAPEAVTPDNHAESDAAGEHVSLAAPRGDHEAAGAEVDGAAAEPSGEISQNDGVSSGPKSEPPAAVCQPSGRSVASQEAESESQSCTVPEDSESLVCKESSSELPKSHDVSGALSGSEPTGLDHSGEEPESVNSVGEAEAAAREESSESSKSDPDARPDVSCTTTSSGVTSSKDVKQEIDEEMIPKAHDKNGDAATAEEINGMKEEAANAPAEARGPAEEDAEIREATGEEEQLAASSPAGAAAEEESVTEKEEPAREGSCNSEEDLYRGAEELSAPQENKPGPPNVLETTSPALKPEDRCSLAPAMDILSYSEREWKGNTAKSALIRKGYKEMSQRFGSVRRVRGDNYCALRATLFQVLTQSTQLPSWLQEEDISMLPNQLEGLVNQWTFPGDRLQRDAAGDAALQLKGYVELLRNKWQAAVDCSSAAERQRLCERVFRGGVEELGLLEALKLLMLGRAVELHGRMRAGDDVPLFCWLLFARDSSDCPRSFLANHLSHVGLSAGLEQVEMFLLGYALGCTIQVYRLYKADTEEFVTYYPDDHKDDWPSVCLVTEDDRHYNVPIVEAAEREELNSS